MGIFAFLLTRSSLNDPEEDGRLMPGFGWAGTRWELRKVSGRRALRPGPGGSMMNLTWSFAALLAEKVPLYCSVLSLRSQPSEESSLWSVWVGFVW